MKRHSCVLPLFVVTCTLLTLRPASCSAQVVQLPTFRVFSVGTTVVVPDRGRAYLGGVSRSARSRTSAGVPLLGLTPGVGRGFGGRAIGSSTTSGGVSIGATIIDHDELDRAVLAEAARKRGAQVDVLGRPVKGVSPRLPVTRPSPAAASRKLHRSRFGGVTDVMSAHAAQRAALDRQ